MSNLSFRPRPIDVNRAIPIFTDADAEELDDRDYGSVSGLSRSVPQMPTGMEAEEEEEAHIQEAIKRSLNSMTAHLNVAVDIPTPSVNVVAGFDESPNPKPFAKPTTYIIHRGTEDENYVDYDVSSDDEEFLAQVNSGSSGSGDKKVLSETKFEYIMDCFEKEADRRNGVVLPFSEMEKVVEAKNGLLLPVYNHWVKRRQDKKHPLNIRYLKPPDAEDPDPYKAFRPRMEEKFKRKGRKNDQASFLKMRQLRLEMERARLMFEMVKRREKLKKDEIALFAPIIELRLEELRLQVQSGVGVGEGAENDLTPPTKRKKSSMGPSHMKRKRALFEEPSYFDFDNTSAQQQQQQQPQPHSRQHTRHHRQQREQYEYEEDEFNDEEDGEDGSAQAAASDAEYSPSEDEAEAPPSPLSRTATSDAQAMEVTQQVEGDAVPRDPFAFLLQGRGIGTFRIPGVPAPFRGRARLGRGGRLFIDRRPLVRSLEDRSSGVFSGDSDDEFDARTGSIAALVQSGYHPAVVGTTDADELLKKLEALHSATSSSSSSGSNLKQKRSS